MGLLDVFQDRDNRRIFGAGLLDMAAGARGGVMGHVNNTMAQIQRDEERRWLREQAMIKAQQERAAEEARQAFINQLPEDIQPYVLAGATDIYKLLNQTAKGTDDIREYEYARNQGFQGDFNQWMQSLKMLSPDALQQELALRKAGATTINTGEKLPGNYRWKNPNNPSEGVVPIEGGPATQPSTAELDTAGYGYQMQQAEQRQQALAKQGYVKPGIWDDFLDKLPDIIGDPLESDEYREYKANAIDWTMANLRDESGAAIGREEAENQWRRYWPDPWADHKQILQKAEMRKKAVEAMRIKAGKARDYIPESSNTVMPLPASPKDLIVGQIYVHPTKGKMRWDGDKMVGIE